MEAWVKGVNPKGNSTNPSNWDFSSSFFFAGTVVTTIGKCPVKEGSPCLGLGSPKAEAEARMWFIWDVETRESETRRKGNKVCVNEQVTGQGSWAHCRPSGLRADPLSSPCVGRESRIHSPTWRVESESWMCELSITWTCPRTQ